ncbi:aminoacetone oxidase family FAD-binding enzyme [Candidatus Kaiserbacteria bacterium CG_4_8_14_3_um_filter_38_9]|uniref:Aminoacetone oxidase family FAD-binding enzyme n=1 Tax=Candidatus Kaiserbacteria bacterium CG_4_8_14_3_um_filter_38_9 TaxID=1974599 RepID=A0A2M7IP62_9BACT|nr:MAG: aminoacetone oxidase family FAD-binding enzyme [Candidatus Kaiserbacteria bacterium CG_4_8_14_3_um_filter_38_9]
MNSKKKTNASKPEKIWDVVIIGGGPAGMMAGIVSARRGLSVLILEKNATLGKKLLITGGGRCNLTNNQPIVREMLKNYLTAGKFLFSTFTQQGVAETIAFFNELGVSLKEETAGRLFPTTNSAETIYQALLWKLRKLKVEIRTKQVVSGIVNSANGARFTVLIANKKSVLAHSSIIACGGTSHPETGSTGEGFSWLKKLGHTIRVDDFALVPIALKDDWVKKLGGVILPQAKLTLYADGVKHSIYQGRILFTHFGISGPTVINLSQTVGEVMQYSKATMALDLVPELEVGALRVKLQELLVTDSNKKLRNILARIVPTALVSPLLMLTKIDGDTPGHSVKRDDRLALVSKMKSIILTVDHLLGADKAVVASGGVALTEINFKTMESRLVTGLYIVGDLLDISRPSGGFSLQICWSTGYVAGKNA